MSALNTLVDCEQLVQSWQLAVFDHECGGERYSDRVIACHWPGRIWFLVVPVMLLSPVESSDC